MGKELIFFQIGCGNSANYAALTKPDWAEAFDLPGIPADTEWRGVLVDLQPASIIGMLCFFAEVPNLHIIHAAVAGSSDFAMVESRTAMGVDQEARLSSASIYNDKVRPDFKDSFFCHTITLDQLFSFVEDAPPIPILADARNGIGLLALDVQGSEVEVLREYSWRIRPRLIDVEPHSDEAQEIVSEILKSQGYTLVSRRPDGRRRVNHLWKDNASC